MRALIRFLGFLLALMAATGRASEIQIDAGPGGNITVQRIAGQTAWVAPDQRDIQPGQWWFYWSFRLRAPAETPVKIIFTGQNPLGVRGPAYSLDGGATWQWLGGDQVETFRHEDQPAWSFEACVPQAASEVLYAFCPHYRAAHLHAWLARQTPALPLEVGELCRSRQGRVVELVRAGCLDQARARGTVLLTSRSHACEAMATYALEGFLSAVLADDACGRQWQENWEVLAVPFLDKDGVENGDSGKNRAPHDHNRDYNEQPLYPEIAALMKQGVALQDRIVAVLDLHCPWIRGEWNDRAYFVGPNHAEFWNKQQRYAAILARTQTGPLRFREEDCLPFGTAWNTDSNWQQGKSCADWAREAFPRAELVTSLELPYADAMGVEVNADSARAFGRDLARALVEMLDQQRIAPPAETDSSAWPFDMRVENVEQLGNAVRVTTTGAEFEFLMASGDVRLIQRIGGRRAVGSVFLGADAFAGLRVTAQDAQHVVLEAARGRQLQVTCDSVLKTTAGPATAVKLISELEAEWVRSTREGTMLLDERGGVGLFPLDTTGTPTRGDRAEYELAVPAGNSVAVCVCPPREYNWKQHHEERIVHQFPELAARVPGDSPRPLPTDEELVAWRNQGNVLVLHLEFWDGFGVQHIKPKDPARFRQVVKLAHELGYLVVPYSSTYYYRPASLADGKLRDDAVDLYLEEAKWLLDEYGVDGLYWDGVFLDVQKAWECARRMRKILGSKRLYVHNTWMPLWDPDMPVPFVDTWADYTLRGETLGREHVDPIYLRYVASGYNISNAIGELCYESCRVGQDMMEWALEANVRIPYWPGAQVVGTKEYFLSKDEDARFRSFYVPAADGVTDANAYAGLAESGRIRREAAWQQRAQALAAGRQAAAKHLAAQRVQVGETDNLAAFKGGACSEYSTSVWSPHGIGHLIEYATDGDPETFWAADHPPHWLSIDLGKVQTIRVVRVTNYFADKRFYHYTVEVSADGDQWVKVGEKLNDDLATAEGDRHEFAAVKARYVKVTMLHNSANWGLHVAELGVW